MAHVCFECLQNVKWSDNICTVGWSCIHAHGWDQVPVEAAKLLCPKGFFTPTSYVDGDERRSYQEHHIAQTDKYGAPFYVLYRGAYFNFPLDRGALQLMQAVGLIDECMVMAADGGRFPFPKDKFEAGGLEDVSKMHIR